MRNWKNLVRVVVPWSLLVVWLSVFVGKEWASGFLLLGLLGAALYLWLVGDKLSNIHFFLIVKKCNFIQGTSGRGLRTSSAGRGVRRGGGVPEGVGGAREAVDDEGLGDEEEDGDFDDEDFARFGNDAERND